MLWFGWPVNGVAFGLFVGAEDGESVQNSKSLAFSKYLYLITFCDVFTWSVMTGSQKNEDVIIL